MRRRIIFLATALAGLSALLALDAATHRPSRPSVAAAVVCIGGGGFIATAGLSGRSQCYHPYPDAGRACTSGSQCRGACYADESKMRPRPMPPNARISGICQPTDYPFGCHEYVEGGRIRAGACID